MEQFKIDEKDRKILVELQKDSRASFSEIGKKVGLPKNVVAYRVKRMVDSGFLTLFCAVISKTQLKYRYYKLFLKFHNFDEKIENKLLEHLKKRKGIHWVGSLNGCYDFCIIFLAKSVQEVGEAYFQIINNFSKYIFEKDLSISIKDIYKPFNYIFSPNTVELHKKKSPSKSFRLTENDTRIINSIKQNSRASVLDLSKKLKLSPKTIRIRIRELIKNQVIAGFKIRINHKMLGFHHFDTFLNLTDITEKKEDEIIDFISQFPSTVHIVKEIGKYDLEFESILRSHFELYEIISKIKNKFPKNIQKIESALIYKVHDINTVKY